jgi:hypothetical protein
MLFVIGKSALISDKVDANPRGRTDYLAGIQGEVLLYIRKVVNFGTMGNQMVNKGME